MEHQHASGRAHYAWALVGLFVGLLLAWSQSSSTAQQTVVTPPHPSSTIVFGPSTRTIGGPGSFDGPADGRGLNVFTPLVGFPNTSPLYCATIENMGDVPLRFEVGRREEDPNVPVGASITRCSLFPGGTDVVVRCGEARGRRCRYRWRVDYALPNN